MRTRDTVALILFGIIMSMMLIGYLYAMQAPGSA